MKPFIKAKFFLLSDSEKVLWRKDEKKFLKNCEKEYEIKCLKAVLVKKIY
jgi:hypothetical protein